MVLGLSWRFPRALFEPGRPNLSGRLGRHHLSSVHLVADFSNPGGIVNRYPYLVINVGRANRNLNVAGRYFFFHQEEEEPYKTQQGENDRQNNRNAWYLAFGARRICEDPLRPGQWPRSVWSYHPIKRDANVTDGHQECLVSGRNLHSGRGGDCLGSLW